MPSKRLSPYVYLLRFKCSVRLGSRGARIPKDDRAGVCEMTSHLKPMPLQATPKHKVYAPGARVYQQCNISTAPSGVPSPLWSLLVDNRVGKSELVRDGL